MLGANARMKHALRCRIAFHRARDGFLRRRVVEVLNLLVVVGFPVDEHADADEQVISGRKRNDAFSDRVRNRLGDAMLRGAKHLNRLLGVLDGDLVEQDRVRLDQQVRRNHREQRREAVLVVDQRVRKGFFSRRAARTHDQIDVRNFIAVANQRFANAHFRAARREAAGR